MSKAIGSVLSMVTIAGESMLSVVPSKIESGITIALRALSNALTVTLTSQSELSTSGTVYVHTVAEVLDMF